MAYSCYLVAGTQVDTADAFIPQYLESDMQSRADCSTCTGPMLSTVHKAVLYPVCY